ncbi:low affinity immunoglobulin gamma Fc region receptor II-like isoform X2 [Scomber scombrus]|uniref:low affinity immunoglobulin gamma Fc region receptor II-like isoform X2 n=1 Tax=Scomber scombrus TaxID=13677 RepID=UPI002DDAA547|nr:low affinity immunoglobulin gamma Fc region receptor II-like isoform X2 [Scomber scombrus]
MQLTPFCLVLTCLHVTPDRSQFSKYDSVSLSCKDKLNSTGWKVKRKTLDGGVRPCSSGWGVISSGSTCIIRNIYPSDTGVYWCESPDGKQSNGVNITVTDRSVVLESPALPVSEGAAMILRCKDLNNTSDQKFSFYKDGRPIGSNSTGEMTIQHVSKSDEGLYKCSIAPGEETISSWVAVEASPPSPSSAPASCSVSVSRLMLHLAVGMPYLLSTILLGLIFRDRNRAQPETERKGSNDVVMEIIV